MHSVFRARSLSPGRVVTSALAALLSAALMTGGALPLAAATVSPASAPHGMVVSSQTDAALAGAEMLHEGGNAVDAAVATAFAISVTQPFSSGLGGGAFILIRTGDGEVIAIDARETAPAAATRDMYLAPGLPPRASVWGPLAVATPGLVAGLVLALEQYGTMSLEQVMEPAIALAAGGFEIGPHHAAMINRMREVLPAERFPETVRIQFPKDGVPVEPGWPLVQEDLAATLMKIAINGPSAFYEGEIAEAIARSQKEQGGLVTTADLANYQPVRREPLLGSYRGMQVYSYPPPSSGGVALIEMLNILEPFDLGAKGAGSSASLHLIAEAMKLAFADRAAYLGDPDYVEVPVATLISKDYAARQRARINPAWYRRAPWNWGRAETVIEVRGPGLPANDSGTTHLSVTDEYGNAVAITQTINTPYGSGITVPGTGILLNNEMDDFAVAPDTPNAYGLVDTTGANAIAPGKRPLSSMTPTIVVKDGKTFMVSGSPGGPRIISTTLLTLLNVIDYDMDVQAAVSAPRIHHQWQPNTLYVEPEVTVDVIEGLRKRGHPVEVAPHDWSSAQSIVIDAQTGWHTGGSDPRGDGLAAGY